jgi:hypothetical protein
MIRVPPLQAATFVVAAIFAARAALRLTHPEFNILRFAVLGWPAWSLWAVSLAELAGAVLLVRGETFRFGALLLAAVAAAFLVTYFRIGVPEAGLGSAGLLAALLGVAMLRRHRVATP